MFEIDARQIRQQFLSDPSRPVYHFLPPSNWMNDPNGVIQWRGQYHLFYQYNPHGAIHANMHWGHAVSDDLIHWRDLPIALAPTPDSVDEGGIFSGCAVNHDGVPTIIYTGVSSDYRTQVQCLATSQDDLLTWHKYPANPVLVDVPEETQQKADFRDPFVWQQDDTWYMLVGSHIVGKGGAVFLYESDNLIDWRYLNPLLIENVADSKYVWECPNFFPLGDKWVLIVSCNANEKTEYVAYYVGHFENHDFIPEYQSTLDYGYLYAPLTTQDDQNQRLLWGWIREGRTVDAHNKAGWAGLQSIPRILSLDADNRLLMMPALQLDTIRGKRHQVKAVDLSEAIEFGACGLAFDMVGHFKITPTSKLVLTVASSQDGSVQTTITYEASTQTLSIERQQSSTDTANERHTQSALHTLKPDETLDLRVLLDGSVIELIANARTSITSRIYPTSFDDSFVRLMGENTHLIELSIYEMPSIWSLHETSHDGNS